MSNFPFSSFGRIHDRFHRKSDTSIESYRDIWDLDKRVCEQQWWTDLGDWTFLRYLHLAMTRVCVVVCLPSGLFYFCVSEIPTDWCHRTARYFRKHKGRNGQTTFLSWAHWWQASQLKSPGHDQGAPSVAYPVLGKVSKREQIALWLQPYKAPNHNVEETSETNSRAPSIFL